MPAVVVSESATSGSSFSWRTYSHEAMVARLAKKAREVRTMANHVRHDPPTVLELCREEERKYVRK